MTDADWAEQRGLVQELYYVGRAGMSSRDRDAIAAALARIDALEVENAGLSLRPSKPDIAEYQGMEESMIEWRQRAEAAEALCRELRDVVLVGFNPDWTCDCAHCQQRHAALAAADCLLHDDRPAR